MTREEAWKQYYDSDPSLFDGGLDENDLAKIQQYFYDGFDSCASELEKENAELKERYDKVDIIGYDALKNLTKAKKKH